MNEFVLKDAKYGLLSFPYIAYIIFIHDANISAVLPFIVSFAVVTFLLMPVFTLIRLSNPDKNYTCYASQATVVFFSAKTFALVSTIFRLDVCELIFDGLSSAVFILVPVLYYRDEVSKGEINKVKLVLLCVVIYSSMFFIVGNIIA